MSFLTPHVNVWFQMYFTTTPPIPFYSCCYIQQLDAYQNAVCVSLRYMHNKTIVAHVFCVYLSAFVFIDYMAPM